MMDENDFSIIEIMDNINILLDKHLQYTNSKIGELKAVNNQLGAYSPVKLIYQIVEQVLQHQQYIQKILLSNIEPSCSIINLAKSYKSTLDELTNELSKFHHYSKLIRFIKRCRVLRDIEILRHKICILDNELSNMMGNLEFNTNIEKPNSDKKLHFTPSSDLVMHKTLPSHISHFEVKELHLSPQSVPKGNQRKYGNIDTQDFGLTEMKKMNIMRSVSNSAFSQPSPNMINSIYSTVPYRK